MAFLKARKYTYLFKVIFNSKDLIRTPNRAKSPSYIDICAILGRFLFSVTSLFMPLVIPEPSANICSSSGVAPPVINVLMRVKALSLK